MTIYKCSPCDKVFPDARLVSLHLTCSHKDTTKQEYYDSYLKDDDEGLCAQCGAQTDFLNIGKGYKTHCSRSCAVKSQYQGERGEQRRTENSKRWSGPNRPAGLSPGRPLGSKNLNPYPITAAVLRRHKLTPPPSWAGKKHSDETRFKMSETRMRLIKEKIIPKVSKYHQGRFNPKKSSKI